MFVFIFRGSLPQLAVSIVGIVLGNGCHQASNQLLVNHNKLQFRRYWICIVDFKGFRIVVIERI